MCVTNLSKSGQKLIYYNHTNIWDQTTSTCKCDQSKSNISQNLGECHLTRYEKRS